MSQVLAEVLDALPIEAVFVVLASLLLLAVTTIGGWILWKLITDPPEFNDGNDEVSLQFWASVSVSTLVLIGMAVGYWQGGYGGIILGVIGGVLVSSWLAAFYAYYVAFNPLFFYNLFRRLFLLIKWLLVIGAIAGIIGAIGWAIVLLWGVR